MLFTITGRHLDITEAIRTHAEEKAGKLPRYYDGITQVEVIIDGSDGGSQSVEIIARGEHSLVFVAKESGDDTYANIDIAIHKLERQIRRKKGKQRSPKHSGSGREIVSNVAAPAEEVEEEYLGVVDGVFED